MARDPGYAAEQADYDYEDSPESCTWCGGEWYAQECGDPIQCGDPRCDGTWHPCTACNGTGLASEQWCW